MLGHRNQHSHLEPASNIATASSVLILASDKSQHSFIFGSKPLLRKMKISRVFLWLQHFITDMKSLVPIRCFNTFLSGDARIIFV